MTVKERIAGVNADEIGRPAGAYRVELLDPRTGKVKERIEKANYLTPMYLNALKWHNAAMFQHGHRWVHLGAANQDAEWPLVWMGNDMSVPPRMPSDAMMSLSSAVAEDTASHWATGTVKGYGTRWKGASIPASGPRGQINEAQSELGADSIKLVWDFNENQGNGAFNSLAIGGINGLFGTDVVGVMNVGWASAEKPYINVPFPTTTSTTYFWVAGVDATKIYYIDIVGSTMVVKSALRADFVDMGTYFDGSGVSLTTEVTLNGVTWSGSNSSSSTVAYSGPNYQIARDGTDWYLAYGPRYERLNLSKWNSAGTKQWTVQMAATATSPGGSYWSCCVIGSNVYVSTNESSATELGSGVVFGKRVWRFNKSNGAATGSIDISGTSGNNTGEGSIVTDGTDLFVDTRGGLMQYDTTGTFIENYGSWYSGIYNESGASPWATSAGYQGTSLAQQHRNYMTFRRASPNDTQSGSAGNDTVGRNLVYLESGKVWIGSLSNFTGITNQSGGLYPSGGGNCWSRSKLDSEVTKSISSTMKWTYELTFPSEWRTGISHLALPA